MKKSFRSSLVAIGFFVGIFALTLISQDSDMAVLTVLTYIGIASFSAIAIYSPLVNNEEPARGVSKLDHLLQNAEKFSQEYGEVYVLADKLKQQRKAKQGTAAAH
ncbi:hypothetical protein [Rufibacter ruber]|uniref:hypothetical protein n=1 Tax=Rufibacter ruber TaxID=1783499 RepID=UPI000831EA33|nr:hypothetical protein [Rufibacter ruber]